MFHNAFSLLFNYLILIASSSVFVSKKKVFIQEIGGRFAFHIANPSG